MRHPPGAILCLLLSLLASACCSGVYRDPIPTASGELLCPRHHLPMTMQKAYEAKNPGCALYTPEYGRLRKRNPHAKPDSLNYAPVRSKEFPSPTTYAFCPVCQANVDAWEARQSRRSHP